MLCIQYWMTCKHSNHPMIGLGLSVFPFQFSSVSPFFTNWDIKEWNDILLNLSTFHWYKLVNSVQTGLFINITKHIYIKNGLKRLLKKLMLQECYNILKINISPVTKGWNNNWGFWSLYRYADFTNNYSMIRWHMWCAKYIGDVLNISVCGIRNYQV